MADSNTFDKKEAVASLVDNNLIVVGAGILASAFESSLRTASEMGDGWETAFKRAVFCFIAFNVLKAMSLYRRDGNGLSSFRRWIIQMIGGGKSDVEKTE